MKLSLNQIVVTKTFNHWGTVSSRVDTEAVVVKVGRKYAYVCPSRYLNKLNSLSEHHTCIKVEMKDTDNFYLVGKDSYYDKYQVFTTENYELYTKLEEQKDIYRANQVFIREKGSYNFNDYEQLKRANELLDEAVKILGNML